MALPLVKLEDIGMAFDIISGFLDSDEAMDNENWSSLNEFMSEYVYNVWVKTGSTFDKKIWNQHGNKSINPIQSRRRALTNT